MVSLLSLRPTMTPYSSTPEPSVGAVVTRTYQPPPTILENPDYGPAGMQGNVSTGQSYESMTPDQIATEMSNMGFAQAVFGNGMPTSIDEGIGKAVKVGLANAVPGFGTGLSIMGGVINGVMAPALSEAVGSLYGSNPQGYTTAMDAIDDRGFAFGNAATAPQQSVNSQAVDNPNSVGVSASPVQNAISSLISANPGLFGTGAPQNAPSYSGYVSPWADSANDTPYGGGKYGYGYNFDGTDTAPNQAAVQASIDALIDERSDLFGGEDSGGIGGSQPGDPGYGDGFGPEDGIGGY